METKYNTTRLLCIGIPHFTSLVEIVIYSMKEIQIPNATEL
jgi:hypothetical protein